MTFDDAELIYFYSRRQALEDGILVDISQEAKESGFKISAAVSDNLFHQYIKPSEGLEGEGQSTRGRLHDVLHMLTYEHHAKREDTEAKIRRRLH